MRLLRLGAAVPVLLLALSCGTADGPATRPEPSGSAADRQCRRAFTDLAQLQGENGNTAPEGTRLATRWDAEYAAANELADKATAADCPEGPGRYEGRFDALIDLGYTAGDIDMASQLEQAEFDLLHAIRTRPYWKRVPRPLVRAFQDLRTLAPAAHADVEEAVEQVRVS